MSYKIKRYVGFVSLVVFLLILSTEARAELYPFEAVSTNSPDAVIMADQLSLEVNPVGDGTEQVEFIFNNNIAPYTAADPLDPVSGIITEVAFEDGTLFSMGSPYMVTGTAVTFVENPPPPHGTWGLGFDTTHFFRADATPDSTTNGVSPGEALGIVFDLQDGVDFFDVITAIEDGFTTSNPTQYDEYGDPIPGTGTTLRIGVHVQNLPPDGEKSDAFILTPEPGSLLLGSIGIGMVIARCRKRKTLIKS